MRDGARAAPISTNAPYTWSKAAQMILEQEHKNKALLVLCFLGLVVSIVAGLADHVSWMGALCTSFSKGCKEAARFEMLRLPVWISGAAFYAVLGLALFLLRSAVFWLVAGAFGVELYLAWIMASTQTICPFCIANLIVVLLLAIMAFDKARFWQMSAVCLLFFLFAALGVSKPTELAASAAPARSTSTQELAAKIGDESISIEDVERPLSGRIHDLELEIYFAKRERLEKTIAQTVLQKEADSQGISVDQLVSKAVPAADVRVDNDELQNYYEANRSKYRDWKGTEEELKDRMRMSLQQKKGYRALMEYVNSLYPKYGVVVYLKEPSLPNTQISIGNAPTLGPADAPVTVVEFSDYVCPICRKTHDVTREIKEKYKGKLRWVFKDYPLDGHKWALEAAVAAQCAQAEGKFWQFQDLLFKSEKELEPERLIEMSLDLNLNQNNFIKCLNDEQNRNKVMETRQEGIAAGVNATPSFIINGKLVTGGLSVERFSELIDEALKQGK